MDKFFKKNKITLSLIVIIVLTFLSFFSSLDNNFTNWDDDRYVTENPLIKDLSWENIRYIFSSFYKEDYIHPLVIFSYMLEYQFFQLDPFIYHLDSLIIHIFNSLLVFYFIYLLSAKVSISLITALLFGIHPLHVESVAWVSERKDVLSTLFFLQGAIFFLLYKKNNKSRYYYLSLFVFILSLLSKAMAVTLPFVLLLCDYFRNRRFNRSTLLEKIPFLLVSVVFVADTLFIFKSSGQISVEHLFSLFDNLLIACRSVMLYLAKTVLPINLSANYAYPRVVSITSFDIFIPLILLLILAVTIYSSRKYTRNVIFGTFFFLITILPVLKLIPFGAGGAPMADRYMYIPSIGLFYIVSCGFHKVYFGEGFLGSIRKVLSLILLCVVIFLFSSLTYQRCKVWYDSEVLWTDVIKKNPRSIYAHYNLGNVYAGMGRLDEAITQYREAERVDPNDIDVLVNLGNSYVRTGRLDEAILKYEDVLKLKPDLVDAHNNLGVLYRRLGKYEEALSTLKRAVNLDPDNADIRNNLGLVYSNLGRNGRAIEEFKNALRIKPSHRNANMNLKFLLSKTKDN